jgi:peptide/nickel transport system permease protein
VLAEPYIVTARAKGLGETQVRLRHALRNSLIPVVSISGILIGGLLMGAVAIEIVFARQGVGNLAVTSIVAKDLPVVQGIVLLAAVAYVALNIVADVVYRLVDPRIR